MAEQKQPTMNDLLEVIKAQGDQIKKLQEGSGSDSMAALLSTMQAQGEELKKLREAQEAYREQFERDLSSAVDMKTVPYEDMAARQERMAEELARLIDRQTHQAAGSLIKKIRSKIQGHVGDLILEALVKSFNAGKSKDPKGAATLKAELKTVVVDPRTASGVFKNGRTVQSTVWPEVEKALDTQFKAGSSAQN